MNYGLSIRSLKSKVNLTNTKSFSTILIIKILFFNRQEIVAKSKLTCQLPLLKKRKEKFEYKNGGAQLK